MQTFVKTNNRFNHKGQQLSQLPTNWSRADLLLAEGELAELDVDLRVGGLRRGLQQPAPEGLGIGGVVLGRSGPVLGFSVGDKTTIQRKFYLNKRKLSF